MSVENPAPAHDPATTVVGPLGVGERWVALDVVRGLAIFGILLVNMAGFSTPPQVAELSTPHWTAPLDRAAQWLIHALAQTKFYSLFSFLFGLGMAIQMERIEARGGRFAPLYVRRLIVLLGFGLFHALLFWSGDVLTIYAVLGLVLLPARRWPDRVILPLALLLHLLPLAYYTPVVVQTELSRRDPEYNATITAWLAERDADLLQEAEGVVAVYRHGTVADMFRQRRHELAANLFDTLAYFVPHVLALFLLGLYVGRRRVLHGPDAHPVLWRGLAAVGMPIGVLCGAVEATLAQDAEYIASWTTLAAYALRVVGTPLLAAGYTAVIVLLLTRERWARRLAPLAAVGRMALTNYLFQTLVCTTLCYSYGLRWYGRITPAWGLTLTVVIFALQVPLSVLWLRHFRFGPLEWLWRSATYLRRQPFREPRPHGLPPPTQGLTT